MQDDTRPRTVHGSERPRHLRLVRLSREAVHVQLPAVLDEHAALEMQLPDLTDLILDAPGGFDATCRGLLVVAWRSTARAHVDYSALPPDARSCLADWLERTKLMDPATRLPVSA